jgi:DnaJ family protein C protein 2
MTDDLKELWLRMMRGHDILVDPKRRMVYDSSLPFDDSLPTQDMWTKDKQFYTVMEEYFQRNAFWSKKKNCPMPGNKDTPMKEVRAFYKFWNDFQSWRVFSQYHKHTDVEDNATDRYDRRHMEKENKKTENKYLSLEKKRIIDLVEFCYNNDPRIIAEQNAIDEEKAKIAKAKKDKYLAEQKAKADALAAIEAAKLDAGKAKRDAAEAESKARGDAIRAVKSALKELKALLESKLVGSQKYDRFWVDGTCTKTFRNALNV